MYRGQLIRKLGQKKKKEKEKIKAHLCTLFFTYNIYIFFSYNKNQKSSQKKLEYQKVASSNTFRVEAHVYFFRLLLMKEIFDPYVL